MTGVSPTPRSMFPRKTKSHREELAAFSHSKGTKTTQMNNYTHDSVNTPQSISMKDQSLLLEISNVSITQKRINSNILGFPKFRNTKMDKQSRVKVQCCRGLWVIQSYYKPNMTTDFTAPLSQLMSGTF